MSAELWGPVVMNVLGLFNHFWNKYSHGPNLLHSDLPWQTELRDFKERQFCMGDCPNSAQWLPPLANWI